MTDQHGPTITDAVLVIQDDRDAAADYLDATGVDWGACGDVRKGYVKHPVVQAFARYRIACARNAIAALDPAAIGKEG